MANTSATKRSLPNRATPGGGSSMPSTFVKVTTLREVQARIRSQLTEKYILTAHSTFNVMSGPNGDTDRCWAEMTLVLPNGLNHTIYGEPTTDFAIALNHTLENAIAWIEQLGVSTARSSRAA